MNTKLTLSFYFLEIRYRFFYILFSFCITFFISYIYSFELIFLLVQPFIAPKHFIFTDLAEALSTIIFVCLMSTLHLVVPLIFYQCWSFSIPGFFEQERKKITGYSFSLFMLILMEAILVFSFLLPEIFTFLSSFEIKKEILTIQLEARIQSYMYLTFQLYFYLLFMLQIPLFFFVLLRYKIVTTKNLTIYRKYSYFFSLLLAALLSPPDIIYQIIIALVFIILYEIGLWLGFIYEKKYTFFLTR